MTTIRNTTLILTPDSETRQAVSEGLLTSGWTTLAAANLAAAIRNPATGEAQVWLVSLDIVLTDEFAQWHHTTYPHIPVIGLTGNDTERPKFDALNSVFAVVNPHTQPLWQLELLLNRAAESRRTSLSADDKLASSYRSLFASTTSLHSSETLGALLESCCREVARGTGFNRAVLVLADDKNRIQSARAYFNHPSLVLELADYFGQPLMPVIPDQTVTRWGRGFGVGSAHEAAPTRHIILPLEGKDGAVLGFLTLDQPAAEVENLAGLSEPIALLLNFVAVILELQQLRSDRQHHAFHDDRSGSERQVEQRLAQDRFTRLVGLTDDIVYLTDAQGRIVYLNETFSTILGFARENYVGLPLPQVLSDLAAESAATTALVQSIESRDEDRIRHELELFTKSGYRRPFMLSHQWIRQAHEIVAGQGILRDISERRELLAELTRAERLGIAGRYASGVAHEINNPLQAIASHLSGLGASLAADKHAQASIGVVADSVDRIRQLTRSLMDMQRPDQMALVKSNVHDVVERALALHAPQFRNAGVDIQREFATNLPHVPMRPAEIEQVCINLITNALQAMPDGGRLTISSRLEGGTVSVEFRDSGKGIAPEILPRLFAPFATYREQGGGLGLGLYLSREIMLQHGGDLRASTPPGGGAQFALLLPAGTQ
ncbi:MAG: PAS domain S-box protein [bacterium]|nr:PAS domain S-box protein [bacterium]